MICKLLILSCIVAISEDKDDSSDIENEADDEPDFHFILIVIILQKEPELKPKVRIKLPGQSNEDEGNGYRDVADALEEKVFMIVHIDPDITGDENTH